MQKIKPILILLLIIVAIKGLSAQEIKSFSLQQALDYAMENNYDLMKSEKDVESAKQKIKESTSIGLPQIDAKLSYNDNLARPTIILPPEFSGDPNGPGLEIQFGTKYDASLGATASQLIFSGEYIVGLKAARKYLESTDAEFFRNKVAVKQQVANSYYNVLTVERALYIIDTTMKVTKNLADETRQIYEVGFGEDIDVDQLDLLVADLEASRINFENQLNLAHAYLKFYLGLGDKDSLILTDDLNLLVKNLEESSLKDTDFVVDYNPDFYSLTKQKELTFLQVDLEKASYLPSINAFLNYQTQAQRETWDFFNSKGKWYSSSVFGVTMNIPILSSGTRSAKLKQAKIAFEQISIQQNQLENQLHLQFSNMRNEYLNSYKVYQNKDKNRKIAKKIFLKTTEKYKQGLASSLDILNTHNQFLKAESDFLTASQKFLQSGEDLKKILTKVTN
jgi:outer membrane protein TolC